jgi:phenylpyruvate tautomerase PptA (4-oxalocrotonate tautomerase family)
MPLVEIHLIKGRPARYRKAIADGVHKALEMAWDIPENARFQLVHEYEEEGFYMDKGYWDLSTDKKKAVIIQIGTIERSEEKKQKLYQELIRILQENPGIEKENLFVQLIPCSEGNWLI